MSRMIIAGVRPYDGAYEIDFDQEFSTREWGWFKRFAGYLPLEVNERAFGDPEFTCVLAVIALHRAGRIEPAQAQAAFEKLEDAPFGSAITIETEPEPREDERRPPPSSSNANGVTSGGGSPTSSATPPSPPNATGIRGSDISVSGPPMSASSPPRR